MQREYMQQFNISKQIKDKTQIFLYKFFLSINVLVYELLKVTLVCGSGTLLGYSLMYLIVIVYLQQNTRLAEFSVMCFLM